MNTTSDEIPNIFDPEFGAYPFSFYQKAIANYPVLNVADGVWLVTGAEQLADICARVEDFSSNVTMLLAGDFNTDPELIEITEQGWPQLPVLLLSDPPAHTRFRRLVGLAFSARRVDAIEASIRDISSGLIDKIVPGERWDFVAQYAIPLPVTVISQQLGLPPEMLDKVRFWTDAFTDRLGGMMDKPRAIECAKAVLEFQHAMKEQIDLRRTTPHDDLLGDLVRAVHEAEEPLDDPELISIIQQLMVAGNETSTSTIAEGLKLLINHPEQLALLRDDRSLIPNAVEEILRLASPVVGSWRVVSKDLNFEGHEMKQGDRVLIRFAAASRDPAKFDQPDDFDVTRKNAKRHFAFGRGIHTCIGNMLARREIQVAIEHLLENFSDMQMAVPEEELLYPPSMLLRGLKKFPVIFTA